jgi:adenosylhomocysteine nucleosidase
MVSDPSKPTRCNGWAFLFALRRESAPFVRRLRRLHHFPDAPCPAALYADSILVLETGVGPARARAAARWLLDNHSPKLVAAAGFAGALAARLRVGDVIVASEVVEESGVRWPCVIPARLTDQRVGRLLTARHLIADPAGKAALGQQFQADFVDMESAAIAAECAEDGMPFAAVRAVSDASDTALSPQLVSLLAGERVAPLRVLGALARSPRLAGELWWLAVGTRRAARNLAAVLRATVATPRASQR